MPVPALSIRMVADGPGRVRMDKLPTGSDVVRTSMIAANNQGLTFGGHPVLPMVGT